MFELNGGLANALLPTRDAVGVCNLHVLSLLFYADSEDFEGDGHGGLPRHLPMMLHLLRLLTRSSLSLL